MKQISILLVEDHTVVRECFSVMLKQEPDLIVVGEAHDGRQAITMALELKPEIILMDIAMPNLNGLEATRQVLKELPTTRIIILSGNSDDASVKNAVDAGAVGYLLKQDSAEQVCQVIRHVSQGGIHYSPTIAKRYISLNPKARGKSGKMERRPYDLTSRETEVLQLVAEGRSNKEIGSELAISIKTVEKHRTQLMRKLHIHDTAGLTRHAIATGIIECNGPLPISL